MPYRDYLETEHWEALRKRALRSAGYSCELCNNKGELNVHHRTYERRGYEWPDDLIVLCRECHKRHHDILEELELEEVAA